MSETHRVWPVNDVDDVAHLDVVILGVKCDGTARVCLSCHGCVLQMNHLQHTQSSLNLITCVCCLHALVLKCSVKCSLTVTASLASNKTFD